jgi:hypothetical protein
MPVLISRTTSNKPPSNGPGPRRCTGAPTCVARSANQRGTGSARTTVNTHSGTSSEANRTPRTNKSFRPTVIMTKATGSVHLLIGFTDPLPFWEHSAVQSGSCTSGLASRSRTDKRVGECPDSSSCHGRYRWRDRTHAKGLWHRSSRESHPRQSSTFASRPLLGIRMRDARDPPENVVLKLIAVVGAARKGIALVDLPSLDVVLDHRLHASGVFGGDRSTKAVERRRGPCRAAGHCHRAAVARVRRDRGRSDGRRRADDAADRVVLKIRGQTAAGLRFDQAVLTNGA